MADGSCTQTQTSTILDAIPFRFVRLRFEVTVTTPLEMHEHPGSMLRGLFGLGLKAMGCIGGGSNGKCCAIHSCCPYSLIFDPAQGAANLYLIEPPSLPANETTTIAAGETFSFHMVLFNYATSQLPLICSAWQHILPKGIAGPARSKCQLKAVYLCRQDGTEQPEPVFHSGQLAAAIEPTRVIVPDAPAYVKLHLLTPMQLIRAGTEVTDTNFETYPLVMGLWRRFEQLAEPGQSVPAIEPVKQAATDVMMLKALQRRRWIRRSNRQKQAMPLSGVTGEVCLMGDLKPIWPLLYLGQWTHIGKHTSFGLGQYRIESST